MFPLFFFLLSFFPLFFLFFLSFCFCHLISLFFFFFFFFFSPSLSLSPSPFPSPSPSPSSSPSCSPSLRTEYCTPIILVPVSPNSEHLLASNGLFSVPFSFHLFSIHQSLWENLPFRCPSVLSGAGVLCGLWENIADVFAPLIWMGRAFVIYGFGIMSFHCSNPINQVRMVYGIASMSAHCSSPIKRACVVYGIASMSFHCSSPTNQTHVIYGIRMVLFHCLDPIT